MTRFSLELDENNTRPIVVVHGGLQALIDTGAEIPICTLSESVIISRFNATKALNESVEINGIGGNAEGMIYILDRFVLGKLVFPELKVFVPKRHTISQHFIIPASMLAGLTYEIDDPNHRLNITVPEGETLERKTSVF